MADEQEVVAEESTGAEEISEPQGDVGEGAQDDSGPGPIDQMQDSEREAAEKMFGVDATKQILAGEEKPKPAAAKVEAPAGFTKQAKEVFLKAPPEVQAEMLKAYKDMQRDYTQKVASVKSLAGIPQEEHEAIGQLLANEQARRAMLWFNQDQDVAKYVTEKVKEFVEARQNGGVPPGAAVPGVDTNAIASQLTPFLEELDGADDENLPEIFLSNPAGLRAIVRAAAGLSAQLAEVKKLVQPVQQVAEKVGTMEERKATLDKLIGALPAEEHSDEFMSEMADVFDSREEELKALPMEAAFRIALEAARAKFAIKAAEARGKGAAAAAGKGNSLIGLPPGGNRSLGSRSEDNDAHLFKKWNSNQGPFDVPEE